MKCSQFPACNGILSRSKSTSTLFNRLKYHFKNNYFGGQQRKCIFKNYVSARKSDFYLNVTAVVK